jgi:hypothetical protein
MPLRRSRRRLCGDAASFVTRGSLKKKKAGQDEQDFSGLTKYKTVERFGFHPVNHVNPVNPVMEFRRFRHEFCPRLLKAPRPEARPLQTLVTVQASFLLETPIKKKPARDMRTGFFLIPNYQRSLRARPSLQD